MLGPLSWHPIFAAAVTRRKAVHLCDTNASFCFDDVQFWRHCILCWKASINRKKGKFANKISKGRIRALKSNRPQDDERVRAVRVDDDSRREIAALFKCMRTLPSPTFLPFVLSDGLFCDQYFSRHLQVQSSSWQVCINKKKCVKQVQCMTSLHEQTRCVNQVQSMTKLQKQNALSKFNHVRDKLYTEQIHIYVHASTTCAYIHTCIEVVNTHAYIHT